MHPSHSNSYQAAAPRSQSPLPACANAAKEAAFAGAYDELFASDAGLKAGIISHPLFEQLLAAHVACLRVGTPRDEQHVIDSALANRHHVAAKYLALLSHLQSVSHPAHDEELNHFMVDYILLLQSFKVKILEHLQNEAVEAIYGCQEIEEQLFSLTGVSSSISTISKEDNYFCNEKLNENLSLSSLAINSFLPFDIQKVFRDHMKQELKQELKKDYHIRLKEVYDEILRKRRAGKLPENTTHFLKDWWISHNKWPYPKEQDKVQLMAETGLDLKQINNWFINQRKRNWQTSHHHQENTHPHSNTPFNDDTDCYVGTSSTNYANVTLSLSCDEGTSLSDQFE